MSEDKSIKGFTIIEFLVAFAVLGIFSFGAMALSSFSLKAVQEESNKAARNIENIEMLKLFTQSIYFGALSGYPENVQLKNCITADGVECKTTEVYSLTPFDIATGEKLKTKSTNERSIKNEVTFMVHCEAGKDACDRAEYFTVRVKTFLEFHGITYASTEKQGTVVPEFNNVVTFVPDNVVAPGRPMNLIVFLDNSNSMALRKDQIKKALSDLLKDISQLSVTLSIYTLEEAYGGTFRRYILDLNGNQIPVEDIRSLPQGTGFYEEYNLTAYYHSRYISKALFDKYAKVNSYLYRSFTFENGEPLVDRKDRLDSVNMLIDHLFKNPAMAPVDQPVCNMVRFIETPGAKAALNIDSLTPTAMLVISNEDDESSSGTCLRSYTYKYEVARDRYLYYGREQAFLNELFINGTSDEVKIKKDIFFIKSVSYSPNFVAGESCIEDMKMLGVEETEKDILAFLKKFYFGDLSYKKGDGFELTKCKKFLDSILFNVSSTPLDTCERIKSGKSPVSKSYVPNSCYEEVQKGGGMGSGSLFSKTPLIEVKKTPSQAFIAALKNKVDLKSFFFGAIVHPDEKTCGLGAGESVGSRYMDIAKTPGIVATVVPLCSPDYAGKLKTILEWTQQMGVDDIQLPTSVASNMSGVEIVRSGKTVFLVNEVDYRVVDKTLVFSPGKLLSNDIVKVYLK